jgi:uncharacterized protein YndB with AHSA1/START domain
MWAREETVETTASPEAIWRLWADVKGWPEWNGDIERIEIDGPFAPGSRISMTPIGDQTVELRLAEVRENEVFVDVAEFGGVVFRTTHRIDRVDGSRIRIVYRTEITGPGADELGPELGPSITADFPQTMRALVERASG